MTLNLKRKRWTEAKPRKFRKVEDKSDVSSSTSGHSELEGEVDGSNAGEEGAGEWGGIADSQPDESVRLGEEHTSSSNQQPTGKELRVIKDATDLFRSSSFKLQIDALLPNLRPKGSRIQSLDRFLLTLHAFLMALPPIPPNHPLEAARALLKQDVTVPYTLPLPSEETNWRVGFEKPSEITLVGSWANKLSVKSKDGVGFGVDLAVEMPDSLFQEKDYLNGRLFHKRAFYLAAIAAAINNPQHGLNVDILYDSLSDDPRLTKLILVARKDDSENDFTKLNAYVCIIPVLSFHSPVLLHRLSPLHSNIRISTSNHDTKSPIPSSPIYNTAALTTLTPKLHLLTAYNLKAESPSFRDALTLLRTWASQRGYGGGLKICVLGFSGKGPWWSALLGLLISGEEPFGLGKAKRKPLGRGLSSYQLFRAALDFLSKHDFREEPIFVKTKNGHRYLPEEYQAKHEITFVDSSSTANLLAGIPLGSLELLRHDALKTLQYLDHASRSSDPFTHVFLKDHRDLATRFDTVLRVDISSAKLLNPSIQTTLDTGSSTNALMALLSSLLHYGLGDRTRVVTILHPLSAPRPLSQAYPSNPEVIYIGLIHNPEHAYRLVDHSPAADGDQSVTQRFRDFWGDKAELRRFKDGRIVESVVWDVKTVDERTHIPGLIVRHVLDRHFAIGEGAVETWQAAFDSILKLPTSISSVYIGSEIATGFKGAITAFDKLVKQIKALDDELPLTLTSVSPVSENLRYTSVFSPVPLPVSLAVALPPSARYLHPIDIILDFERSSKWPDDLRAIQKIKLAFFERIATTLMKSVEGLKAIVVVSDGIDSSEILDQTSLEIVTPEGWAFSARIWHDREVTLLDRILHSEKSTLPHITQKPKESKHGKAIQEAVEAKIVHVRRFVHAPRHHRAIASLCHRYSALSGTIRLVKRWLASHWLLQGHVREEAVELICASIFVGDYQGDVKTSGFASVPGTKERGFATIIDFLKEWNWRDSLHVPVYDAEPRGAAELPSVKLLNTGVWVISTEFDKEGHMWTSPGPDLITANRVRALAKATWDYLQIMEQGTLDVRSMFIHPDDDYDFIVRLNHTLLPRYFQNISVDDSLLPRNGKYVNLSPEEAKVPIRPGFDPARLLFDDLQRVYADTFKIFFDPFGGNRFGVVWDPTLKQPRAFRVLSGFSSIPVKKENERAKDKDMVTLNEGAILSEIERLGTGLIQEIVVHV